MREKILKAPKRYLEKVGFIIRENKAKYVKRLWADGVTAIAYSGISAFLIVIQEADIIVLFLNILCVLRATINNTISASQVTFRNDYVDIIEIGRKYKYYHIKATLLAIHFILLVVIWVVFYSNGGGSPLWIKIYSIIAIGTVLFNDLENDFVCAYDAVINPIV